MTSRLQVAVLALSLLGGGVALAQPRGLSQAAASSTVTVKVGAKKTLGVQDIARVAVTDPEIADIRVSGTGGEVEVTGRAAGTTQVTVWTQGGAKVSYEVAVSR